ncbi:MAG: response regulator [Planctomycetota bacterium]
MTTDRLLLVDDDVEFVETMAERMRIRGLQVDVALDGPSALKRVAEKDYDVMVLDVAMPGMSGVEVLRRLRQSQPSLQIILLTGCATVPIAVEVVKLGAFDILEKPADVDALLQRIREARLRRLAAVEKESQERIDDILRRRGW